MAPRKKISAGAGTLRPVSGLIPNEIFVKILSNVRDLKTKVKLEAVSKSCQKLVREHCWKHVTTLDIDLSVQATSRAFGYSVNREFCSSRNVDKVIGVYDTRGLWLANLNFGVNGYLSVGEPSPITRIYQCLTKRRFLEHITSVSVHRSFAKSKPLAEFLSHRNFRFSLRTLNLQWPNRMSEEETYKLWVSVGQMVHLEDLKLESSAVDRETSDYDLVKALRGKPLKSLQLHELQCISGEGLADALRLCDSLRALSIEFGPSFLWEDFAENIDPEFFSEITRISCAVCDFSFSAALKDLPAICPKLLHCESRYSLPDLSLEVLAGFVLSFLSQNEKRKGITLQTVCEKEEDIPDFFQFREAVTQWNSEVKAAITVKHEPTKIQLSYTTSFASRCAEIIFVLFKPRY